MRGQEAALAWGFAQGLFSPQGLRLSGLPCTWLLCSEARSCAAIPGQVQFCPSRVGGVSEPAPLWVPHHSTACRASTVAFCYGPCMLNIPVSPQLVICINPLVVSRFACRAVPNSWSDCIRALLLFVAKCPPSTWTDYAICPSVCPWMSLPFGLHEACYSCDLRVGQTFFPGAYSQHLSSAFQSTQS